MKPCFHFEMKCLLVGMILTLFLGTTMSNAQEITPTVDLNAYIPKRKEKLDTFTSQGFPFVIVRGWVKGKNFVEGSPIRVEFIHLYVEPKEGQNVSTSTSSIFFEGSYTIRDEKSYIVGRAVEQDEKATRIYQGSFFIHETGKNILSAHSENIEQDENINDLLVYATVYETDGSSITNSIAKKLPNGRWLVQIVNSDWEKEMKPHDTIYSIVYTLEEDGILNINFKNGDKYEVSMKDGQGKYYFANGDIYEGFISDDVVLGYEWYQDFSNTTVTFSNGERAKKNWMEILVDSCNCDVNFPGEEYSPLDRLINRSTSASDFRNNVRELINTVNELSQAIVTKEARERKDSIITARNNKIDKLNKKKNNFSTYIQKRFPKYGSYITNGQLVVGMTKEESDYALKFHVLYRGISKYNEAIKKYESIDEMEDFDKRLDAMNTVFEGNTISVKTLYKKTYSQQTQYEISEEWELKTSSSMLSDLVGLMLGVAAHSSENCVDNDYTNLRFENGKLVSISSGSGW